jgi:hypothetical protein
MAPTMTTLVNSLLVISPPWAGLVALTCRNVALGIVWLHE